MQFRQKLNEGFSIEYCTMKQYYNIIFTLSCNITQTLFVICLQICDYTAFNISFSSNQGNSLIFFLFFKKPSEWNVVHYSKLNALLCPDLSFSPEGILYPYQIVTDVSWVNLIRSGSNMLNTNANLAVIVVLRYSGRYPAGPTSLPSWTLVIRFLYLQWGWCMMCQ